MAETGCPRGRWLGSPEGPAGGTVLRGPRPPPSAPLKGRVSTAQETAGCGTNACGPPPHSARLGIRAEGPARTRKGRRPSRAAETHTAGDRGRGTDHRDEPGSSGEGARAHLSRFSPWDPSGPAKETGEGGKEHAGPRDDSCFSEMASSAAPATNSIFPGNGGSVFPRNQESGNQHDPQLSQ